MLFILLGITFGVLIALLLNKFVANKIENKHVKLGVKIAAYVVLIILGLFFGLVCSIKPLLSNFIDSKINAIEITLNRHFPNEKVMEVSINANDFSEIIDQLQQSLNDINIGTDGYFEKLVFSAFINRINVYINDVHRGINSFGTTISDKQGEISLKSTLYNLKDLALKKITPYLVIFVILIIIVFVIFIGIYTVIVKSFRKRI
jgi:methyl-accepting chemotaxis protein